MLTIIFPVLNERLRLESGVVRTVEYLEGMDFTDYEIIIVDTGSSDRTKEVAAEYTDKIYDFVWVDDFAAARNFAFSKCTKEYIYTADADEVIDAENRQRFLDLKQVLLPVWIREVLIFLKWRSRGEMKESFLFLFQQILRMFRLNRCPVI